MIKGKCKRAKKSVLELTQIHDTRDFVKTVSDILVSSSASVKHLNRRDTVPEPKPNPTFSECAFVVRRLAARFHALDQSAVDEPSNSVSSEGSPRVNNGGSSAALPPLRILKAPLHRPQPLTPALSTYTKRIAFRRRAQAMDRNLLILAFEGVLGSVSRPRVWSHKKPRVCLREHADTALHQLLSAFQVVLFLRDPQTKAKAVLEAFEAQNVRFDAIYKNTWTEHDYPFTQNYDQVLKDFLMLQCHVLVGFRQILAPLEVAREEIEDLEDEDVVLRRSGRRLCEIYVYPIVRRAAPTSTDSGESPVVYLVPDFRAEETATTALSLPFVAESVQLLHRMLIQKSPSCRLVQWPKCYESTVLRMNLPLKVIRTNALHLEMVRRALDLKVNIARRHFARGLQCLPKFDDHMFCWNECICERPAKCSSQSYPFCDTHMLLCHYYISGKPLPTSRAQIFVLPRKNDGDKRWSRTVTQTYS